MYNEKSLFVDNSIYRYIIGQHILRDLRTHRWLTDIYIQNASHGKDKEFDWLPAPEGRFKLMLHMYLPEEQILN